MRRSILLFLLGSSLWAIEIRVNIKNGSTNRPGRVEEIRLVHLQGGMNVIKTLKNAGPQISFKGLENSQAPYMVQAFYRGVNYNKVFPPVGGNIRSAELLVYDISANPRYVQYKTLYDIRYFTSGLKVFALYNFSNDSRYTFSESEGGVYVSVPEGATQLQASVSVGGGGSNIQWLKLGVQQSASKPGFSLLNHPVKPGGKIYRVEYVLPYPGKQAEVILKDYYTEKEPTQLFLEPADVSISLKEFADWRPQRQTVNELKRQVISLPVTLKPLTLKLSGGTALEATADTVVTFSLTYLEKFAILAFTVLILGGFVLYLARNPAWLQRLRQREKDRLEVELQSVNLAEVSQGYKEKRIDEIKKRILQLENFLQK